jgi:hypothetical protein
MLITISIELIIIKMHFYLFFVDYLNVSLQMEHDLFV